MVNIQVVGYFALPTSWWSMMFILSKIDQITGPEGCMHIHIYQKCYKLTYHVGLGHVINTDWFTLTASENKGAFCIDQSLNITLLLLWGASKTFWYWPTSMVSKGVELNSSQGIGYLLGWLGNIVLTVWYGWRDIRRDTRSTQPHLWVK